LTPPPIRNLRGLTRCPCTSCIDYNRKWHRFATCRIGANTVRNCALDFLDRNAEPGTVETVAFIAAMKLETRPFLRRIGRCKKDSIGPFTCFRFRLSAWPCLLVETGVGRAHAADAIHLLLSETQVRLVVSFGIAGAPRAGLDVGDVVAGRSLSEFRGGILGPARPLAQVSPAAWEAAKRVTRHSGARLLHGVVITTRAEQTMDWNGLDHPVLEMETAAVEEACSELNVPLIALRSISDSVEAPLPFSLSEFLGDQQQLLTGRFVAAILRNPRLLPAFLRLIRNARKAADNAAAATVAAVTKEIETL
jgi:adenosylhomocysteine nucleosidase